MTIGLVRLELFIQDSASLKERRHALHSIKARLRNHYNVAVTQLDDGDKWQRATLVVVGVEKDRRHMDSMLSGIVNFIETHPSLSVLDHEIELF